MNTLTVAEQAAIASAERICVELTAMLASSDTWNPSMSERARQFQRALAVRDASHRLSIDNQTIQELRQLLDDPEIGTLAEAELLQAERQCQVSLDDLRALMRQPSIELGSESGSEKDPDQQIVLKIRAGEGGEEAALWAGDLMRMYLRFAERQGCRGPSGSFRGVAVATLTVEQVYVALEDLALASGAAGRLAMSALLRACCAAPRGRGASRSARQRVGCDGGLEDMSLVSVLAGAD